MSNHKSEFARDVDAGFWCPLEIEYKRLQAFRRSLSTPSDTVYFFMIDMKTVLTSRARLLLIGEHFSVRYRDLVVVETRLQSGGYVLDFLKALFAHDVVQLSEDRMCDLGLMSE